MKKFILLLTVAVLIVSGCNNTSLPSTEKESESPSKKNVETKKKPQKKDEVHVVKTAIGSEPDNLDPWVSAASDTEAIMGNVFEGLLWYDENGKLIPSLAKSFTVSDDGLTYTFVLRENVKFHNGDAFDAKDVVYSIEKLAGLSGEKPLSSRFKEVKSVTSPDTMTAVITLKQKNAAFLAACVEAILPKGYKDHSTKPIGTGPFKFETYEPGQKIVITKNVNYWGKTRAAKIEKAEFYIISDPTAVVNGLLSGQLDFAGIDPKNVSQVESEFNILTSPQNMVQLMALNNKKKPFKDIKVRQAINYAINKDDIIAAVANGYGTKLSTNMSPIMAEYFQSGLNDYAQDIQKAKLLLKEAGYENGFKTSVTVPANYQFHVDTAQVVANQLSKIGIEVEIKQVEWGVWLEKVYKQFEYDMTIIGLTGKLDPHQVLVRYSSEYARNFMQYSNDKYDKLIETALLEINEAERISLYKKCQTLLAEEAAAVYIMDPNLVVAIRKDLDGFKFYPLRYLDMSSIEYKK